MVDAKNGLMVLSPATGTSIEGSTEIVADCGHNCWISPVSKKFRDSGLTQVTTHCVPCAVQLMKQGQVDAPAPTLMPGQVEELEQAIGPEAKDWIEALNLQPPPSDSW